jgi:hypothetical protein
MPESKVDIFYTEVFGDTPPTLDAMYPEVFGDSSPKIEMAYVEIFGDTNESTTPSGDPGDPEGTGVQSVGVGLIGNFGVEVLVKRNPPPPTSTSGTSLYIYGNTSVSSGIPLFVSGEPHRGDIPLYTASVETGLFAARTLYTYGVHVHSTGIPLYIEGNTSGVNGIPLYTISSLPMSGLIPLYIEGHLPYNTGIPLYIEGAIAQDSGIPLYIANRPESSHIALYIGDLGERQEGTIPLYLFNAGAVSGMNLVVWGEGENIDWITANGRINLYIRADGVEKSMPLYLTSPTGEVNGEIPLYLGGSVLPTTGIPLFIGTQYDIDNDRLKLYTHGF